jgi:D-alanine-D-alanine ligase
VPVTRDLDAAVLPDRVRLVILFGGQSAEHDVSCVSAREVVSALDPDRYEIVPIGIQQDGTWVLADEAQSMLTAGKRDELPTALSARGTEVEALPTVRGANEPSGESPPTVVFPVLHGPMGEDGTVQGLLELTGIPYVGSGVLGSALAMDKAAAKDMAAQHGIAQAEWRSHDRHELTADVLAETANELGFPIFVKPANMGSSIGISKASTSTELDAAVDAALEHDNTVVFEETVSGREIEIGVLGTQQPRTSVPGEIIPGADFYDYEDKYHDGRAKHVIPADLPPEITEQVGVLAVKAFRAVRAQVLARVDFFYEENGRGLLLNEVNTLPGCTPISMFPLLWRESGLSYAELLDELVRLALARST